MVNDNHMETVLKKLMCKYEMMDINFFFWKRLACTATLDEHYPISLGPTYIMRKKC